MTPYEKAQQFLESLEGRAAAQVPVVELPTIRYAQIGTPDMACASVIVGVTTINPDAADEGPVVCDASQLATFLIVVCLECSWTADEEGINDPVLVADASARLDVIGQFLWDWANELDPFVSKEWTLGFTSSADLGIATLRLITGVD
jgi:hypothetical protein